MPGHPRRTSRICTRVATTTCAYLAGSPTCQRSHRVRPPTGPEVGGAGTAKAGQTLSFTTNVKPQNYGTHPDRITGTPQPRRGVQRAARYEAGISHSAQFTRCAHRECNAVHTPCSRAAVSNSITSDVRTLRYRVASEASGPMPASEYPEGSDLRQRMLMTLIMTGSCSLPRPVFEITVTPPPPKGQTCKRKNRAGRTNDPVSWCRFQDHLCPVTNTQSPPGATGNSKDLPMMITLPLVSDSKRAACEFDRELRI